MSGLSLSRVTLYKNNLAFAERQGALGDEGGPTGLTVLSQKCRMDRFRTASPRVPAPAGAWPSVYLRVAFAEVVNTLSASAPGGASIIFGKGNSSVAPVEKTYPFDSAGLGQFLESCRGAEISVFDGKERRSGALLMVEKQRRTIENSEQTEDAFAWLQIFSGGTIHKIPFHSICEVPFSIHLNSCGRSPWRM